MAVLPQLLRFLAKLDITLCCRREGTRAQCRGMNLTHTLYVDIEFDVEPTANAPKTFYLYPDRVPSRCKDEVPVVNYRGEVVLCNSVVGEEARCEWLPDFRLEPVVVLRLPAEELRRVAAEGETVAKAMIAGSVDGRPALGLYDTSDLACGYYVWDAATAQNAELALRREDVVQAAAIEAFKLPSVLRGSMVEIGVTKQGPVKLTVIVGSIVFTMWMAPYAEKVPVEFQRTCVPWTDAVVEQRVGRVRPASTTVVVLRDALVGQPYATFRDVYEVVKVDAADMPLPFEAPTLGLVVPLLEDMSARSAVILRDGGLESALGEVLLPYEPVPYNVAMLAILARAVAEAAGSGYGEVYELYSKCRRAKQRVELTEDGELYVDGKLVDRLPVRGFTLEMPGSFCRRGARIVYDDKLAAAVLEKGDTVLVALPSVAAERELPRGVEELLRILRDAVDAWSSRDRARLFELASEAEKVPEPDTPFANEVIRLAKQYVRWHVEAAAELLGRVGGAATRMLEEMRAAAEQLDMAIQSGDIEELEKAIRGAKRVAREARELLNKLSGEQRSLLETELNSLKMIIEHAERALNRLRAATFEQYIGDVRRLRAEAEEIAREARSAGAARLAGLAEKLANVEERLRGIAEIPVTGLAEAAARALTEVQKAWSTVMRRARELAAGAETREELQELRRVAEAYREAGHGGPTLERLEEAIEERARELERRTRRPQPAVPELTEEQVVALLEHSETLQRWLLRQKFVAALTAAKIPYECYLNRFSKLMEETRGEPLEKRQKLVEELAGEIISEPERLWRHFARTLSRLGLVPEDYREEFQEVVAKTWCKSYEERLYAVDELIERIAEKPLPPKPPRVEVAPARPKRPLRAPRPVEVAEEARPQPQPPPQPLTISEEMLQVAMDIDIEGRPCCSPEGYAAALIRAIAPGAIAELFFMNPRTRQEAGYTPDILAIAAGVVDSMAGGGYRPEARQLIEAFVRLMRNMVECEIQLARRQGMNWLLNQYEKALKKDHYWYIVLKKYGLTHLFYS